jgi:hypothetical protein
VPGPGALGGIVVDVGGLALMLTAKPACRPVKAAVAGSVRATAPPRWKMIV